MRALALLALLAACSEYDLKGEDPSSAPHETGAPPPTDTEPPPDTGPSPTEACNGVDDDGDGEVDEGFEDIDADGVVDCVDKACDAVEPPRGVAVLESCTGGATPAPADPWNSAVMWQWEGGAVQSTPSVGDLDRDGVPEVVFTASESTLWILDGATGAAERAIAGVDQQSGVALGDLDGDGYGDLVATAGTCSSDHTALAYDRNGVLMWTRAVGPACETYPYITDLEGDGRVEVIVQDFILDGATGAVLGNLDDAESDWGAPVAVDLDGDGRQEILLENRVYDATGAFLWSCGTGAGSGTFPQPVNLDADADGELLVAAPGVMTACDLGGAVLWTRALAGPYGAPVAVADFDGDGAPEFAIPSANRLYVVDTDGSDVWSAAVQDLSGLAGCTSWDVDADGVPEVVYADEVDFLVLDGATGDRRIVDSAHASGTLAETPAVADVDGDGRGDLVYGSNFGLTGLLTVLTSALDEWPYAPPVYNQYGYYGANIHDDLSVPAGATPPWLAPANLFRGQPSAIYFEPAPNAGGAIADVCAASCDPGGYAEVAFQVTNDGSAPLPAGTTVEVHTVDDPKGAPLYTWATPLDLEPGDSVEHTFSTTVGALGPALRLVVDGAEAHQECNEDDNVHVVDGVPCY